MFATPPRFVQMSSVQRRSSTGTPCRGARPPSRCRPLCTSPSSQGSVLKGRRSPAWVAGLVRARVVVRTSGDEHVVAALGDAAVDGAEVLVAAVEQVGRASTRPRCRCRPPCRGRRHRRRRRPRALTRSPRRARSAPPCRGRRRRRRGRPRPRRCPPRSCLPSCRGRRRRSCLRRLRSCTRRSAGRTGPRCRRCRPRTPRSCPCTCPRSTRRLRCRRRRRRRPPRRRSSRRRRPG